METLAHYFKDENFDCNDYYEGKNFYEVDALNIITSLLFDTNSNFSKNEKLRIIERLKKLNTSEVFEYYLDINLGGLIRKVQKKIYSATKKC